MKSYLVTWEIEIDAETPEDAAREAYRIHSDPDSIATVFEVQQQTGDGLAGRIRVDVGGIGKEKR